jgi:hypothetical protein
MNVARLSGLREPLPSVWLKNERCTTVGFVVAPPAAYGKDRRFWAGLNKQSLYPQAPWRLWNTTHRSARGQLLWTPGSGTAYPSARAPSPQELY